MSASEGESLPGGNTSVVRRVGDTVRRSAGPWTPAVHDLLRHLRAHGFDLAPKPLGLDDQGRETLRYLPGDTVGAGQPWPSWVWADDMLVQAAAAARSYHEAVRSFRPIGPVQWRDRVAPLAEGEIVCHNDFAPYNVVVKGGRLVGLIDWDFAAPGTPLWDLAFMAWQWDRCITRRSPRRSVRRQRRRRVGSGCCATATASTTARHWSRPSSAASRPVGPASSRRQ